MREEPPPKPPKWNPRVHESWDLVTAGLDKGFITGINYGRREAWVTPAYWAKSTDEQIEGLALALSVFIAYYEQSDSEYVTILDTHSDTPLARYSRGTGISTLS